MPSLSLLAFGLADVVIHRQSSLKQRVSESDRQAAKSAARLHTCSLGCHDASLLLSPLSPLCTQYAVLRSTAYGTHYMVLPTTRTTRTTHSSH